MFAMIKLRNQPITSEEWGVLFDFMIELNGKGFSYDDIYNNLFFRRNADGKLTISLIDFENENYSDNLRDLQRLGSIFNSIESVKAFVRLNFIASIKDGEVSAGKAAPGRTGAIFSDKRGREIRKGMSDESDSRTADVRNISGGAG